jgi:outer membrane protease
MSLTAKLLGGATLSGSGFDTHWLRNTTFLDAFGAAPYVGVDANLTYAVNEQLGLTLSATYDRHITGRGPTTIDGLFVIPGDGAGGSLETLNVAAGLSYSF